MADTVIALPKAGSSGGDSVPIKAIDLGDGTYAIAVSNGTTSAVSVAFPAIGSAGAVVTMATVLLDDGTYALKTQA